MKRKLWHIQRVKTATNRNWKVKIFYLLEKDFKSAVLNIFQRLKETVAKEIRKCIWKIFQHISMKKL